MRSLSAVATLVVSLFCVVPMAEAQGYTFTKVNYPGSTMTETSGINNLGQVVGTYTDAAGKPHGFIYQNGTYTTLDYPGTQNNFAFGISHSGRIVGSDSAVGVQGPYHAWIREPSGTFKEYDYPGMETDGRAINGFGHTVGIYNAGYGTPDHGFLQMGDNFYPIDYPGATYTYVFGLNDAGTVTGTYRDGVGLLRGFIYQGGNYVSMLYPGSTETFVGGTNNANVVVGWNIQNGRVAGFVLTGGSYRPITASFAGAINTKPRALNDLGVVVGTYSSPDCPVACSFIATPNPSMLPQCNQTMNMTYANSTLTMNFTLTTTTPTTWTTWLGVQNQWYRLWTLSLPALLPFGSTSVPLSLAPSGNVTLISTLSTPALGTVCVDIASKNTGGS